MLATLKGIVTEAWTNAKGYDSITVVGESGTWRLSSKTVKLTDLPRMIPVELELTLRGMSFRGEKGPVQLISVEACKVKKAA